MLIQKPFLDRKPLLGTLIDWTHPLAKELVGCWLFNEGAGNKVYDLSGLGNHGTFGAGTAAPTWVPGRTGSALDFDGTDYVDCGRVNITGAFTVVTWMKQTTDVNNGIAHRDKTGDRGWYFLKIGSTNELRFLVSGDGTNVAYLTTSSALADTDWHHLVAVFDPGTLKIYVDAVNIPGTTSGSIPNSINAADTNLDIGRVKTTFYLNGTIDDVRIYNRALSASEIWQLYIDSYCMFTPDYDDALYYKAVAALARSHGYIF